MNRREALAGMAALAMSPLVPVAAGDSGRAVFCRKGDKRLTPVLRLHCHSEQEARDIATRRGLRLSAYWYDTKQPNGKTGWAIFTGIRCRSEQVRLIPLRMARFRAAGNS